MRSLILFVTAACDSHCRTCFYSEAIRHAASRTKITPSDMRRLALGLGRIRDLSLSGGEPVLREDLEALLEPVERIARPYGVDEVLYLRRDIRRLDGPEQRRRTGQAALCLGHRAGAAHPGARLGDGGEDLLLLLGEALDGLDEIGNEIVPSFQLNVDVSPGVSGPVSQGNEIVVCKNTPDNKGNQDQQKYNH